MPITVIWLGSVAIIVLALRRQPLFRRVIAM
jgi:hypothetical protein